METTIAPTNAVETLQRLTLSEVDARLAELDAERAALSTLRRSLVARDKSRRRTCRSSAGEASR